MFLHSCVLTIHVNQTPRLTEILCFPMLCFARAFLSYSCVFPIHAFIESSNSKDPLHIYFISRLASKKTLCVMSRSCRAVIHPTWGAPSTKAFTSRDPPCRLSFAASDHLPRCRQPRQLHYHHRLSRWTWGLHSSGREITVFCVCLRYTSVIITCYFFIQTWVLKCPWVSYRGNNE